MELVAQDRAKEILPLKLLQQLLLPLEVQLYEGLLMENMNYITVMPMLMRFISLNGAPPEI